MDIGTKPARQVGVGSNGGTGSQRSGFSVGQDTGSRAETIGLHVDHTMRLVGPVLMGHLSNVAMITATMILFGWLSAGSIAAIGLATRVAVSTNILAGILLVVGIVASGANGARDPERVAALYWNGLFLTGLLSVLSFCWMSAAPSLLTALGQPPEVVAEAEAILNVLRWGEPANLLRLGLMRSILPTLGMAWILYALTPASVALYIIGAIALTLGLGGLPAIGSLGIPIAMVATTWLAVLVMLAAVHGGKSRSLVPFTRIRLAVLREMFRLGLPVGTLHGADGIFFFIATVIVGQFGAAILAAHHIALTLGSVAYSLAVSCGDAAALRISFRRGAGALADARRAGFVGIAIGTLAMAAAALVVLAFPTLFISFFIDIADPANAGTVAASLFLMPFACLFIFADGLYGTGMGVLRGLGDNRYAMLVVIVVYWVIGLSMGIAYHMVFGLGPAEVWLGLGAMQGLVGLVLVRRYAQITREGVR